MKINSQLPKQAGFSLLEILIAFSILAISMGILLNIFSSGVNAAINAEDYTVAVEIAESLLAKTGSEFPLKSGKKNGVEDGKYVWNLDIRPYTLSNPDVDPKNMEVEIYSVSANVEWGDEEDYGDRRRLSLATLKLAGNSKNNVLSQ